MSAQEAPGELVIDNWRTYRNNSDRALKIRIFDPWTNQSAVVTLGPGAAGGEGKARGDASHSQWEVFIAAYSQSEAAISPPPRPSPLLAPRRGPSRLQARHRPAPSRAAAAPGRSPRRRRARSRSRGPPRRSFRADRRVALEATAPASDGWTGGLAPPEEGGAQGPSWDGRKEGARRPSDARVYIRACCGAGAQHTHTIRGRLARSTCH
eukprot:scaffold4744_cov426-Prasinococcus_capsulatus_cf.AAC.3